jgi:hypothetical protein
MTLCRWIIGSGCYNLMVSCSVVETFKTNNLQNIFFLRGKPFFFPYPQSYKLWHLLAQCDKVSFIDEKPFGTNCDSRWQNNKNFIQQWWLTLKFLFCGMHYGTFSITDYIVSVVGWRVNLKGFGRKQSQTDQNSTPWTTLSTRTLAYLASVSVWIWTIMFRTQVQSITT